MMPEHFPFPEASALKETLIPHFLITLQRITIKARLYDPRIQTTDKTFRGNLLSKALTKMPTVKQQKEQISI